VNVVRVINLAVLVAIIGFVVGVGWALKHLIGWEEVELIDLTRESELTDEEISSWLESGGEQ
jgi:hypothetical protein